MNDITNPLRLATGSHPAGSGKGCVMNLISWENGDATITDMPSCADPMLARVIQRVNDAICTHRDGDLLCPECSMVVLDLGHRIVGTNLLDHGWSQERVSRLHVTLAVEAAESVLDRTTDETARRACALVRRWLAGDAVSVSDLRTAYDAYAVTAVTACRAAAAYAAYAAYDAACADAYAAAAYADAYAVTAVTADGLVDRFLELAEIAPHPVAPEQIQDAYASMTR